MKDDVMSRTPTSGFRTKRCRPRDSCCPSDLPLPNFQFKGTVLGSRGRGTLAHASTRRTTPTRKHTGARSLASVPRSRRAFRSSLRAAPRCASRRSAFQILARARVPTSRFKKPRGARSEIARLTPSPHPRFPRRHAGWIPPPPLPRVNGELMARFIGKKVLLVGKTESTDGATMTVRTPDDKTVTVQLAPGAPAPTTTFVEFEGMVDAEDRLTETSTSISATSSTCTPTTSSPRRATAAAPRSSCERPARAAAPAGERRKGEPRRAFVGVRF